MVTLAFPTTVALGPYLNAAEQAMGISYQDGTGIGDVFGSAVMANHGFSE